MRARTAPPSTDCPAPTDSRDEQSGRGHDATNPDAHAPRWLTADDPIGAPSDRQVLVVGDGPAGMALGRLLARAGIDPVVVGGRDSADGSGLTLLTPALGRLLGALGIAGQLRDRGDAVERVTVDRSDGQADETVLSGDPDRPAPAVVRTHDLRRALGDGLPGGRAGRGRHVEALARRERGVEVTFDDGVREWFDVVVDARAAAHPLGVGDDRDPAASTALAQWEVPAGTGGPDGGRLRALWCPNALAQSIPRPDGSGGLLRITASGPDAAATGGAPRPDDLLADLPASLADRIDGDDASVVRQAGGRPADAGPGRWGDGRVARCGAAAFPVAPASGLGPTLAVADAWVLAEELVRGPASAPAVVAAYARRRSRRTTALFRRIDGATGENGYPVPGGTSRELSIVGRLRGVALAGVCGPAMTAVHEDVLEP